MTTRTSDNADGIKTSLGHTKPLNIFVQPGYHQKCHLIRAECCVCVLERDQTCYKYDAHFLSCDQLFGSFLQSTHKHTNMKFLFAATSLALLVIVQCKC